MVWQEFVVYAIIAAAGFSLLTYWITKKFVLKNKHEFFK